jgi:hypothetical protein
MVRELIHPSAWKEYSRKSIYGIVHRAPVRRRIRTLRTPKAQNSNYHISRTGIKMCSDQYAAPHEHANRGEGYQELRPPGLLEETWSA